MRIVIADDHGIVRSGVKLLLDRQADMEVIAEAEDGVEAVAKVIEHRPDIAILDVSMPRMTGLQATHEIKQQSPDTQVLILSMHDDERYLFEALRAGASGYVLKRAADQDLVNAVRAAGRGEPFLTSDAQQALIRDFLERGDAPEELTPREQEVVKLIAEAHTNKEIAEILHLSEKTVESHRARCCRSSACATGSSSSVTRSGGVWSSPRGFASGELSPRGVLCKLGWHRPLVSLAAAQCWPLPSASGERLRLAPARGKVVADLDVQAPFKGAAALQGRPRPLAPPADFALGTRTASSCGSPTARQGGRAEPDVHDLPRTPARCRAADPGCDRRPVGQASADRCVGARAQRRPGRTTRPSTPQRSCGRRRVRGYLDFLLGTRAELPPVWKEFGFARQTRGASTTPTSS